MPAGGAAPAAAAPAAGGAAAAAPAKGKMKWKLCIFAQFTNYIFFIQRKRRKRKRKNPKKRMMTWDSVSLIKHPVTSVFRQFRQWNTFEL